LSFYSYFGHSRHFFYSLFFLLIKWNKTSFKTSHFSLYQHSLLSSLSKLLTSLTLNCGSGYYVNYDSYINHCSLNSSVTILTYLKPHPPFFSTILLFCFNCSIFFTCIAFLYCKPTKILAAHEFILSDLCFKTFVPCICGWLHNCNTQPVNVYSETENSRINKKCLKWWQNTFFFFFFFFFYQYLINLFFFINSLA